MSADPVRARAKPRTAGAGEQRAALLALPMLSFVAGCDEPLLKAERIENLRVLGARVESAVEPRRAWPLPGESASVELLVADAAADPLLGWALSACVAEPTTRGVPDCAAPAFAEARSSGPSRGIPSLTFTMPDALTLASSGRVLVSGAVCKDAEPVLGARPEQTQCDGELRLLMMDVSSERPGATNSNPAFAAEAIALDGALWSEPSAEVLTSETCLGRPTLPMLPADGRNHELGVALRESDRDRVDALDGTRWETLGVSHFSTSGELDRAFSILEPTRSAEALTIALGWQAPRSAPAEGRTVRFYFVVRDLRGGVDWTRRALCLVP